MSIRHGAAFRALEAHAREASRFHLRELMADAARAAAFVAEHDGMVLDYSRQIATPRTLELLFDFARERDLEGRIAAMASGEPVNVTEGRAALHVALRARAKDGYRAAGKPVMKDVLAVRSRIARFAAEIRSGKRRGATGKKLTDVVAIGIGGSYLGPEFVAEALRHDPACAKAAKGRRLRFLSNVDPIDVARALDGLEPKSTLVIVISKTFTTAETMLNARTARDWLVRRLGKKAVASHMVAVSTNLDAVAAFGIDPANAFGFWDWVGGRYSVTSAVGLLPLALQYGPEAVDRFLDGARDVDRHFLTAPLEHNLPVLLGVFGVWNSTFLGHPARAILPYCQALLKLAPHVQQVDMESNGKRVALDGEVLDFEAGEIDFGEPGTNGQHSFYQLVHQGRVVPADFIGFKVSQNPLHPKGEAIANHDELMANFFAQPDALAFGKTRDELRGEGVPEALVPHKEFPGNRPSNVLLLDRLDAAATGRLLALYEHRTVVQGFLWGVNSFDQMGVELGKVLATKVRSQLERSRARKRVAIEGFNPSTTALLARYLRK
jgi:glucose-6-phosphate isomerase